MNNSISDKIQIHEKKFYLLRVSVGPVQEFISEARKTIDLYIGSKLLSEITKKSMKPIIKNYGQDAIIYPYIQEDDISKNSTPNLYNVVIPENGLDTIITLMETEVHVFLKEKSDKILGNFLKIFPDNPQFESLWNNQINNHFYLNWVAILITEDDLKKSYKTKIKHVQDCLEERKLTRTFGYWYGNNANKCVQCGHRESIQDDIYSKLHTIKEFKAKIKKNEKLCAVCLFKRFLEAKDLEQVKPKFESVVDVSVRNFKKLVENYQTENEIKDFLNYIKVLKIFLGGKPFNKIEDMDGEWFYSENLSNNYLKKEYEVEDNAQIKILEELSEPAQKALEIVYDIVNKTPSKYYTIVIMDGDDMGKLMSGEYHDNNTFTIESQKQLSKTLDEIGSKSFDIIEEPKKGNGFCVYSGGDDLLAFLPIERSLPVINETRLIFSEEFGKINEKPTSSAGIVILHYHYPLSKALNEAKNSIENAKEWFKDKDALVITLIVSSGTEITWGSKWTIQNFTIQQDNSYITIAQIQILDVLARFVSFMTECQMYLFSWDNIPGSESEKLIDFLKQNFDIDWVTTENIEKINAGKIINVSFETNSLSLILNDERTKVNLKIADGRTYEFIVKTENGRLNIYDKNSMSTGFIYDFLKELPVFYSFKADKKYYLDKCMFKAEFNRLLKRHIPEKSKLRKDCFLPNINTLELFTELFAFMANPDHSEQLKIKNQNKVKENFEHFLLIAVFLARQQIGDHD